MDTKKKIITKTKKLKKMKQEVEFKNKKGEILHGLVICEFIYKNKNKNIEKKYFKIQVKEKFYSVDPKNIINKTF